MSLVNNKVTLAFPNRADEATLSGAAIWSGTLPRANMQDRILAKKARTTVDTGIAFNGTFPLARPISCIALASHNMTTAATWRVRLYSDSASVGTGSDVVYDSGFINVWPAVYTQAELEWEYPNFWTGQPSDEELDDFTPLATHFVTDYQMAEGFTIEIEDAANPDTYVEIGRLFISKAFQPEINMSYGAQTSFTVQTEIEEAEDGTEYFDIGRDKRTASFTLENMLQAEAYGSIQNLQRALGISGELLFAYELETSPQTFARTFLGRLEQIDPIAQPYFARFSTAVQVKEIT